MSDTPKTDEVEHVSRMAPRHINDAIRSEFARKLERENAELKEDNDMLRQMLDLALRIPGMSDSELKELIQNCKAVNDSARKEQP